MTEYHCLRCGHVWQSKSEGPDRCPGCLSRRWDHTLPAYHSNHNDLRGRKRGGV